MRVLPVLTMLLAGLLAGRPASPLIAADFVKLYNGKDLAGWHVQNGDLAAWKAEGELLICNGDKGGWLASDKIYSDFILKLEYRIPVGGNSGVGLRFPPTGDPAHVGMEIQILDDDADVYKKANLVPAQHTGGIYYQAAAKQGVAKPAKGTDKPTGEWNAYEITCRGPQVTVKLNGQVVNDVNVDKLTEGHGGHKALAERPQIGSVGLQSHGTRVEFRNLEIQDLTTTTATGLQFLDLQAGTGSVVPAGAMIEAHYTGRLADGKKFDGSRDRGAPQKLPLSAVIQGWQQGIPGMKVGGRRKLVVPPSLGFGKKGQTNVPPDSTLVYEIEVTELPTE